MQLLRTVRDKLGEQALDVLIETREQENRINYKQAMIGAADLQERGAPDRDPLPRRLYGRMASGRGRYLSAGGKSLPDLRRRHRLPGLLPGGVEYLHRSAAGAGRACRTHSGRLAALPYRISLL